MRACGLPWQRWLTLLLLAAAAGAQGYAANDDALPSRVSRRLREETEGVSPELLRAIHRIVTEEEDRGGHARIKELQAQLNTQKKALQTVRKIRETQDSDSMVIKKVAKGEMATGEAEAEVLQRMAQIGTAVAATRKTILSDHAKCAPQLRECERNLARVKSAKMPAPNLAALLAPRGPASGREDAALGEGKGTTTMKQLAQA